MSLWSYIPLLFIAVVAGVWGWRSRDPKPTRAHPSDEVGGRGWRLIGGKLLLFEDAEFSEEFRVEIGEWLRTTLTTFLADCQKNGVHVEVQALETNAYLAYALYAQGYLRREDFVRARSGGSGDIIDMESGSLFPGITLRLSILPQILPNGYRFIVVDGDGTSHVICSYADYTHSLTCELSSAP